MAISITITPPPEETVTLNLTTATGPAGPTGATGPAGPAGETPTLTAAALLTPLGIPSYASLTAANAALAIGAPYYDTTLGKLQIATA